MNRTEGRVGILVPEGRDRDLIRGILESQGLEVAVPTEGPRPAGPWTDLDLIVVDLAWLERVREAVGRTRRDAGSEFVPVLLVAPRDQAPDVLPDACDQMATYPTTRAHFAAQVNSLMRARVQSRKVYRSFFENALIGVYRARMDGEVLMANDALARMLGFSGAGPMKEEGAHIPGLDPAGPASALPERLQAEGRAEAVPEAWRTVDGQAIHVLHSARIVGVAGGSDLRPVVEGTVEDVTELVQSREELAASERFLQRAIDALSAHVAILSPEATILGVNQAWRSFETAARPEGATDVGVDYLEVCDRADDPSAHQVAAGIRAVIGGERPMFQMDYPCHSPTRYRWFRVVVTGFPEPPPRRTVVAHEDITELKQAQRRFQLLIEGGSELTLVLSDTGFVKYRSPSSGEFVGTVDLEGRPLGAFVHPLDRDVVDGLPSSMRSDGTVEFRLRHADGSWRDVEWTVTDMRDTPLVHGVSLHGRDITERNTMLAELRHREREIREMQKMEAVGLLAGGVAHDFNNLLTTIRGNLTLAREALADVEPANGEGMDEFLGEIGRAVEQGSFLTRRLLMFSRQEPETDPSVEDLDEILRSLVKMLRRVVPETIDFELELSGDRLPVRIHPGEVEQVVVNLTVNAVHAMSDTGGTLAIRTGRIDLTSSGPGEGVPIKLKEGNYATLEVADTGEGIPPENQERIFEPFFTTKATGEGTGLGLATVYGILERAGGGIDVYSEVGLGTRFICYLAMSGADVVEEVPKPRSAPVEAEGQETLLLVEDEESVRTVARRGLERLGYTVLEAEHGRAAQERLSSADGEGVSAIVTDLVMPEMTGSELAAWVHAHHPGIPLLLTSGYASGEIDLPEGLVWETLAKPYDLMELVRVVRRMIDEAAVRRS